MSGESGARASGALSGELWSRPLAVLLAGAGERGASGTFVFRHGARRDSLTMHAGKIAVVRTSEPVAYLGSILYELGRIDMETLNTTLLEVARARRLHGEVLAEQGAVSQAHLDEALIEQTFRNVHHLFSLPDDATWTFREDVDELTGMRDEDRPAVDTWHAIWRGLREQAPTAHARQTLAKLDGSIHLADLRGTGRFGLAPAEMALCERLHAQPSTVEDLVKTSPLIPERTEQLVYLLALSRSIVRAELQPLGPLQLGVVGVRERARRIDTEDPHTILGLTPGASLEAARAAYFRLARLWHADKIPAPLDEVRSECEQVFVRLGDAHRILTDVGVRKHAEAVVRSAKDATANDSTAPAAVHASMRDVDTALARNDVAAAMTFARSLTSAGADGPSARAVVAWCAAGAGAASPPHVLEDAIGVLDKILTGDPECVRALFYRGQLLKRLGRAEPALRDFRKVVRLDARHIEAQREVRLYDMRHRPGPATAHAEPVAGCTQQPAHAGAGARRPQHHAEPNGDERSVRSGLRRLLARVAGR